MTIIYKISQNDSDSLSGPEIDELIATVHMMIARGAPNEFDDQGFNKNDWSSTTMQYIMGINAGSAVPISIVSDAIARLNKYKNTQLTNYDSLKSNIIRVVHDATATEDDDRLNYTNKVVQYIGRGEYGKEMFLIPQFGRGEKIALNRVLRAKMQQLYEAGDERYKEFTSNYGTDWPVFKAFSPVRSKIDHFDIHPDFMSDIADVLDSKQYDVSVLRAFHNNDPHQTTNTIQTNTIKSIVLEQDLYGKRVVINLGSYIPEANALIKNQPQRRYSKEDKEHLWTVPNPSIAFLEELSSILQDKSYDTTEIKGIIESLESDDSEVQQVQDTDENQGPIIEAYDVSEKTGGKWLMHIPYPGARKLGEFLNEQFKDVLKYNFVGYTKNINDDDQNIMRFGVDYGVYLRGVQNDFYDFERILKSRGLNTSGIGAVISQLISKGVLLPGRQKGELDGYESGDDFISTVRSYQDAFQNEFYPEQVDGISFLYGNQSALLGDDVGVGKTPQCIVAADMRLKQSGGKCVVVTVNSVVSQYMEQIAKIAQIDPKDVSDDPFSDAQYRVLKYTLFSSQGSREDVTKHLVEEAMSGDITVLILDEIHNVKNGDPRKRNKNGYLKHTSNHTTFNIQEVSQHIPFVWGASATIVANKPVDLYNQLVAINHKMGKLSYGGFKYVFNPDDKKQKLVAADKIKHILLDQRIYVQRTKQAIRGDMPEQFVSVTNADVDTSGLNNQVKERLLSSRNPDHPLTGMTAFRTSIAEFKVPKTLSLAEDIIIQGRKVAIFTTFNPPADMLVLGLNAIFEKHGIDGSVAQIRGGQRNRPQVIENFTNPDSNDRAIVINIAAGGTGLDFPNILTDIIVNDFDWSVAQDKQSLGRFYRINSEQDINVTYVIANNTADLVMYQQLESKREVADRVQRLTEEQMQMLNDGIREDNERFRELTEERHGALIEQDEMQSDNDIIQDIGSQIIRDANEDTLASSYLIPNKSWYSHLKTS